MSAKDEFMSPEESALGESILRVTQPVDGYHGPESLESLIDAWLGVAMVRFPAAAGSRGAFLASVFDDAEELGDGMWVVASALPGQSADLERSRGGARSMATGPDPTAVERFIALARQHVVEHGGAAAVVVRRGRIGRASVLGPGPQAAAVLYRQLPGAVPQGLWIDGKTRAVVAEPAEAVGAGYRLAGSRGRRGPHRWRRPLAGALAAAAVLTLAVVELWPPSGPSAQIFVGAKLDPANKMRGEPGGIFSSGDTVHVRILQTPGSYVTLLLLGSNDRISIVEPYVNRHRPAPSPSDRSRSNAVPDAEDELVAQFSLDDHPGKEQFIAVVSRRVIGDWPSVIADIDRPGAENREERLERLRSALSKRLPDGTFSLGLGAEIRHGP